MIKINLTKLTLWEKSFYREKDPDTGWYWTFCAKDIWRLFPSTTNAQTIRLSASSEESDSGKVIVIRYTPNVRSSIRWALEKDKGSWVSSFTYVTEALLGERIFKKNKNPKTICLWVKCEETEWLSESQTT